MKINRIELDKSNGLTIQIVNGLNQQTIFLDGENIIMQVKGLLGTSTIEQTPTSVTVTADNFTVAAKTITIDASLEASVSAGAIPVPALPSKVGNKLTDKFGARVANLADKIADLASTDPSAMTPGPTRITLIPTTASVLAPTIMMTAETAATVAAPAISMLAVAEATMTAPAGAVALMGLTVDAIAVTSIALVAPTAEVTSAAITLGPGETTVLGALIPLPIPA